VGKETTAWSLIGEAEDFNMSEERRQLVEPLRRTGLRFGKNRAA
jgi:hypothetical protein